jgi:hypothetical protein
LLYKVRSILTRLEPHQHQRSLYKGKKPKVTAHGDEGAGLCTCGRQFKKYGLRAHLNNPSNGVDGFLVYRPRTKRQDKAVLDDEASAEFDMTGGEDMDDSVEDDGIRDTDKSKLKL